MKTPFQAGDQKQIAVTVTEDKLARFDTGLVHPLYSTFALGQDAEWAGRQFVLEMKEEGEEGIGTFLEVEHLSPGFLGSEVVITATLESVEGRDIVCSFEARAGERLLARGRTGQRILDKARFEAHLQRLQQGS
jgi:fluoroacetyl-CoA thioesterase